MRTVNIRPKILQLKKHISELVFNKQESLIFPFRQALPPRKLAGRIGDFSSFSCPSEDGAFIVKINAAFLLN